VGFGHPNQDHIEVQFNRFLFDIMLEKVIVA